MFVYKFRVKKLVKNFYLKRRAFCYYYNSSVFNKFLNNLMKNGKKQTSLKVVNDFFVLLKKKYKMNPYFLFLLLVQYSFVAMELVKVTKSGRIYQLGQLVKRSRRITKSVKVWAQISKLNKKINSASYLLVQARLFLNKDKKSDITSNADLLYKTIVDNLAFKHFRWFKKRRKSRLEKRLRRRRRLQKYSIYIKRLQKYNSIAPTMFASLKNFPVINLKQRKLRAQIFYYLKKRNPNRRFFFRKTFYSYRLFFLNKEYVYGMGKLHEQISVTLNKNYLISTFSNKLKNFEEFFWFFS